jgi:hypothetical protein
MGDWGRVVRDPIDLLRATFFIGAAVFLVLGEIKDVGTLARRRRRAARDAGDRRAPRLRLRLHGRDDLHRLPASAAIEGLMGPGHHEYFNRRRSASKLDGPRPPPIAHG